MARKEFVPVRSGRFSVESLEMAGTAANPATGVLGNPFVIVNGHEGAVFRIFNSHRSNTFIVDADNGASSVPLGSRVSVDVLAGPTIEIGGTQSQSIEGVYDIVEPGAFLRSGRFGLDTGSAGPLTIVQQAAGGVYRIFNSGKQNFKVTVATGGVSALEVLPRQSVDVPSGISTTSSVSVAKSTSGSAIQGMYDRLDATTVQRTGHFKIKNGNTAVPIIDLTGMTTAVWYRLFNSGEFDIQVKFDGANPALVKPDQSLDFELNSSRHRVTVQNNSNNKAIQGIYDFLGQE